MEPTNNWSERALGLVTLHKKMRLVFGSPVGMMTYGILVTCMTSWNDQGMDMTKKIHEAIMSS